MNKTPLTTLLAAALSLGLSSQALAECQGNENPAIPEATPSARFVDLDNGLVLDRPTQLIWMRCAVGQSWTGSGCSGSADALSWAQALVVAEGYELAGQSDWRVPNRNELAAIVESRCHGPAINGAIFPDSPSTGFWTSSPLSGQPGPVWSVDFDDGRVEPVSDSEGLALRLVRAGRF